MADSILPHDDYAGRAPWNRADRFGLILNILIPVTLCLLINGIIFSTGMNTDNNSTTAPWFAPPGWAVGSIWMVLYVLYGAARWTVLRDDGPGAHKALNWITFLIFWGLSYPFLTLGFDMYIGAVLNAVSLLFTLFALYAVRPASIRAFWMLIPSALWESFAVFLGFYTLTHIN